MEGWHCRDMAWLELMVIWTEIKISYLKCLPPVGSQAKCIRVLKSWRLPCNLLDGSEFLWASEEGSVLLSPRTIFWFSYTFQLAHCRTVFLNFLYMNSLEINIEVKPLWPFGFFLFFFFNCYFKLQVCLGKLPEVNPFSYGPASLSAGL